MPISVSGIEGWATKISGLTQIDETGVKSLSGSYGGLVKAVGLMACVDDVANRNV